MAKRKGLADELLETLVLVPWWVGPVLAVLAYVLAAATIPALAPLAFLIVLIFWLAAEFKKWQDRLQLDGTRGLPDVKSLSWREFEALVGEAYRRKGYVVEETGSPAGDGGVDLVLFRERQKTVVQCKQWRSRQVGVKVVRELSGAMRDLNAAHGIVVCCGKFTAEATAFARRNGVALVGGDDLVRMIRAVQKGRSRQAPEGGGSSEARPEAAPEMKEQGNPCCPSCGTPMVMRTARKGAHAGTSFWGCPRFPGCRGTRRLDGA